MPPGLKRTLVAVTVSQEGQQLGSGGVERRSPSSMFPVRMHKTNKGG
jgi:hypothetical protein